MTSEEFNNDENKTPEEQNVLDRESVLNPFKANKKSRGAFGLVLMGLVVLALFFIFKGEDKPKDGLDKEPLAFEPAAKRPLLVPEEPPVIEKSLPEEDQALKQARLKSAIVVFGASSNASGSKSTNASKVEFTGSGNPDPNAQFQEGVGNDAAQKVKASFSSALGQTILSGKLIDAVLETAISSDLPGMVRAIVSHDVYAEAGDRVLIPRGSRLLGQYNSEVRKGQSRVFVVWTRVVRPDGIEVALNSGGTDSLGRAGLSGNVNHHFWQMFGTSMLLSIIGSGTANVGVQPTNPYNSASAYRQQVSEAFQNSASQALADNINIPPTINVKQGALIKVFVARDLDFSEALASLPTNNILVMP